MEPEEYNNLLQFLTSDPNNRSWPHYVTTKNEKSNYRKKTRKFRVSEGTLFKEHSKYGLVRVIKETEKADILRGCHTDPVSGHQGMNRTIIKIRERYFWQGMEEDIKDFVRNCDKCQRQNRIAKATAELHPIPVKDQPFTMLGLDLVGPLHETEQGNKYIAVLTDYFTKWPEVRAIPSKSADHIANFILDVICRHGTPSEIITDRGREFCNKVNEELCKRLKIQHKVTSPYHPQTNGLTERFNQTLCNALTKYVNDKQNDWDLYIQQVAFAARTCNQKSTKQTPFYLVYGRKAVIPIQLDIPTNNVSTDPVNINSEAHLESRISSFVELLQVQNKVKETIKDAQMTQKHYYDRKCGSVLHPGQQVLVRNSKRINRKGDKMMHRWTGPFFIKEYIGKGVYKVHGRKTVLNRKNIKVYHNGKNTSKTYANRSKPAKQLTFQVNHQKSPRSSQRSPKRLKSLKTTLHCKQKNLGRSKHQQQKRNISKKINQHCKPPLLQWIDELSAKRLESLVQRCAQFKLPQPKSASTMMSTGKSSPTLSLYLKWQKESPDDLDKLTTLLAEKPPACLKPYDVNPFQRVPAIMVSGALLLEAYHTQLPLEDILLTLDQVPLGYPIHSKVKFTQNHHKHFSVDGIALTSADLTSLNANQWLTDQVIHAILTIMCKEANNQRTQYHCYLLPSFLAIKWEKGDYNTWLFPKICLNKYQVILMPVCHHDHWFLLAAYPQQQKLEILDSIHNEGRRARYMYLHHWRLFMHARGKKVKQSYSQWILGKMLSSKQEDNDSCGVFVVMNAAAVLQNKPPTVMRQCHVQSYRKFVTHRILTCGL